MSPACALAPRRLAASLVLALAAGLTAACHSTADESHRQAGEARQGKDVVPVAAGGEELKLPQPAFAGALGDLGMRLLRDASLRAGHANSNALVSPLAIANSLGMVHAGARGATAGEIAQLLVPGDASEHGLRERMQAVNAALAQPRGEVQLFAANRMWLSRSLLPEVDAAFAARLATAYRGDGVALDFADGAAAAQAINRWVDAATQGRIGQIVTPAGLPASTRAVATSALYFKGRWQQAFDPAATRPLPFHPQPGQSIAVATMSATLTVRQGVVNNLQVVELPYAGSDFALLVALPVHPAHTLDALEKDTTGQDIAAWGAALAPARIALQLPKFRIEPTPASLKEALLAAGVRTAFAAGADFGGLAAKADLVLDNVIHAAGVVVDEQGSEAAAATAAVVRGKSLALTSLPEIRIDRPFLFAIVHTPTATPLFLGKVYQPAF